MIVLAFKSVKTQEFSLFAALDRLWVQSPETPLHPCEEPQMPGQNGSTAVTHSPMCKTEKVLEYEIYEIPVYDIL